MSYEDERVEELAEQGVDKRFAKQAIRKLKEAGMDDQSVDIAAYYDRNLSYQENTKLFSRNFPTTSSDERLARTHGGRHADNMDARGYAYRAEQVTMAEQKRFEEHRNKKYNPKYKQLPGSKKYPKSTEKTEMDEVIEGTPPKEPNALEKAQSKVLGLKSKYIDEPVERRKTEQRYKRKQRYEELTDKVAERRAELQLKQMERELGSGRMERLSQAKGVGNYLLSKVGVEGNSAIKEAMFGGGGNKGFEMLAGSSGPRGVSAPRSGAANLLFTGGPNAPQRHKGGHYRTIIERGRTRREWVPPEGQMEAQPNPALALLSPGRSNKGNGRDLSIFDVSGRNNKMSRMFGGGNKKGFPNFLGKGRRR